MLVVVPSINETQQLVQTNPTEYPLTFDTRNQNIPLQQIIQDNTFFPVDILTTNNTQNQQESTTNQDNQSNDHKQFVQTQSISQQQNYDQVTKHISFPIIYFRIYSFLKRKIPRISFTMINNTQKINGNNVVVTMQLVVIEVEIIMDLPIEIIIVVVLLLKTITINNNIGEEDHNVSLLLTNSLYKLFLFFKFRWWSSL